MTDVRLYRPRISTWWWTRKRTYLVFVMRELSSIFIAWLVLYLVLLVYAVGRGEAAYRSFLDWASSPWVIALNVVGLAFEASRRGVVQRQGQVPSGEPGRVEWDLVRGKAHGVEDHVALGEPEAEAAEIRR